jgi:hypothetical protein
MTLLVLLSAWRVGVPAKPGDWMLATFACDVVGLTLCLWALWRLA